MTTFAVLRLTTNTTASTPMLPEGAAHLHALRCPPTSPGLTSLHMLMPRRRCGRSVAATTGVVRIGHGHEWNFPAGRGRRSAARRDRKRVRLYALRSPDCGFRRERQRSGSRQKEAQVVRFVGEGQAADLVRVLAHADHRLRRDLHVGLRVHTPWDRQAHQFQPWMAILAADGIATS